MDLFSSLLVVAATSSATDAKASNDATSCGAPPTGPREPRSFAEALAILRGPRRQAVAFLISALTSPFLVCAVAAGALAMHMAPSWRQLLLWGALTSVFAGVIPFLVVYLLYLRGGVADMHVAERRKRWIPLGASFVSGIVGLIALWAEVWSRLPAAGMILDGTSRASLRSWVLGSFWTGKSGSFQEASCKG